MIIFMSESLAKAQMAPCEKCDRKMEKYPGGVSVSLLVQVIILFCISKSIKPQFME